MRVYLSARYDRRFDLCLLQSDLARLGHLVVSRWINGSTEVLGDETLEALSNIARKDTLDLWGADCLIAFTEPPGPNSSLGCRHIELGFALAWEKRVIVVGPVENAFHALPSIERYPTWIECMASLWSEAPSRWGRPATATPEPVASWPVPVPILAEVLPAGTEVEEYRGLMIIEHGVATPVVRRPR